MNRKEHWNQVYQTKSPDEVSWFQKRPDISLNLIEAAGVAKTEGVIDVGGGASVLVDFLLDAGFKPLAVLDISDGRDLGGRAITVNIARLREERPTGGRREFNSGYRGNKGR